MRQIWKTVGFDFLVIEFGPVAVFFVAYYVADFPTAAVYLGAATILTLLLSKIINKRIPYFALFAGFATIVTAFVTYWFTAPWVLIVKDSLYYSLFALGLGFSLRRGKLIFKQFFGHVFAISDRGWRILQSRWMAFFLVAAVSNEMVRMFLSVSDWVLYKQFLVLVFISFGLYQFKVTRTYRLETANRFGLVKK